MSNRWSLPFRAMLAVCGLSFACTPSQPVVSDTRAVLPSVSPDGRWIAFLGGSHDSADVFVMRTDGSRMRRVAATAEPETSQPAWAPDGRSLFVSATVSSGDEVRSSIFRLGVRDGERSRLLDTLDATLEHVSPDGRRLLLSSGAFPSIALWESAIDGSGLRRLVSGRGVHYWGRYSADGTKLVYVRMIPGRNATLRIETVEIAGGASGAISDSSSRAETPAWSADGRWIALQRRVDGNTDIYVMRPDGSELRRVTESPALDEAPTWAHDGRRLYFQSDRDGPMHIYAVDLSDGRETRISP